MNKQHILYGYHPGRIEEKVLGDMLKQSIYPVYKIHEKDEAQVVIHSKEIEIKAAIISVHIQFMDPYELCAQISANQSIPVFLIASQAEKIDIPKAFAKGIVDIIRSPYIKPLVLTRISNYLRLHYLESVGKKQLQADPMLAVTVSEKATSQTTQKKSNVKQLCQYQFSDTQILLAEDNEVNQQLMTNILNQSGVMVDIVNNGREAIDKIKDLIQQQNTLYDAILMDIHMPVLDGFKATHGILTLLESHQQPEIPIIAITAHTMIHSRENCLRAGMVDFVPKPIDPKNFIETLAQWIHSDKVMQSFQTSVEYENTITETFPHQISGIDIKMGLKRAAGNESLFKKLLLEFYKDYQNTGEQLKRLKDQRNFKELKHMAHTLKGLGGNIGAEGLYQSALSLDHALKQNNERDIETALVSLIGAHKTLIQGIKQNLNALQPSNISSASSVVSPADISELNKSFDELHLLLNQGRTAAVDYFKELKSRLPERLNDDGNVLESLISSYDFDEAIIFLSKLHQKISSMNIQSNKIQ